MLISYRMKGNSRFLIKNCPIKKVFGVNEAKELWLNLRFVIGVVAICTLTDAMSTLTLLLL